MRKGFIRPVFALGFACLTCIFAYQRPPAWFTALEVLVLCACIGLALAMAFTLFFLRIRGGGSRKTLVARGNAFIAWFLFHHLLYVVGFSGFTLGVAFFWGFGAPFLVSGCALFGLSFFAFGGVISRRYPPTLAVCWSEPLLRANRRGFEGMLDAVVLDQRYESSAMLDLRRDPSRLSAMTRLLDGGDLSSLSLGRSGLDRSAFVSEIRLRAPAFVSFFTGAALCCLLLTLVFDDFRTVLPFGVGPTPRTSFSLPLDHVEQEAKVLDPDSDPSNHEATDQDGKAPARDGQSGETASLGDQSPQSPGDSGVVKTTSNGAETPVGQGGLFSQMGAGELGDQGEGQSGGEALEQETKEPGGGEDLGFQEAQAEDGPSDGPGQGGNGSQDGGDGDKPGAGEGMAAGNSSRVQPGEGPAEGDLGNENGSGNSGGLGSSSGKDAKDGKGGKHGVGSGEGKGQGGGFGGKVKRGAPIPPPVTSHGVEPMVTLDLPALGPPVRTDQTPSEKEPKDDADLGDFTVQDHDAKRRGGESQTEPVQHLPNWIRVLGKGPDKKE